MLYGQKKLNYKEKKTNLHLQIPSCYLKQKKKTNYNFPFINISIYV